MEQRDFLDYAKTRRRLGFARFAGPTSLALGVIVIALGTASVLSIQSYDSVVLTLAYGHHLVRLLPLLAAAGIAVGVWGWRRNSRRTPLIGMAFSGIGLLASLVALAFDILTTLGGHHSS